MDVHQPKRLIDRFLIFRLAAVPIAFALVTLCRSGIWPEGGGSGQGFLYGVLGFYTLLTVGAIAAPVRFRRQRWFVVSQVAMDFALAGALIWLTGGVESIFCPLLFIALFNATTVLRGREALTCAALSTAFLAAAVIRLGYDETNGALYWTEGLFHIAGSGDLAHLVALGIALHAVAILGIRLAHGLRSVQGIQEEIIENIAEGLLAVDGNMRIIELNGEARRVLGIPGEQACIGRPLDQVLPGHEFRPVREAFADGARKRFEFLRGIGGGRSLPVEAKISSIDDGGGRLRCRIGLFGDLSLKKEVEEAERRIQKLEELYDMAMGIAHEIRNPLASIRGCVQEIGRSQDRTPTERRMIDIVCRESDRLDRIIEEFMTNARRGPLSLRPVDLVHILEDTVLQLQNHPGIASRRIMLEPRSEPALVSGDWQRLKQVFLNLGMNAIDATDPEKGTIRISMRREEFLALNCRRAGERRMVPGIEVEFSDNGTGIPPEMQKLIFTPFFTTKERGQGLGLAIVHRIVHDHLGKVEVESRPGAWTTFRVWFPLLPTRSQEPAPERAAAAREVVHA